MNRLLPALEVDDGEAAHREAHRVLMIKAVLVRPAMTNPLAHTREQALIHRTIFISDDADDATHVLCVWRRTTGENGMRLSGRHTLSLAVFPSLFHQDKTDCHKHKIEDENLRALAIGRADVALKDGIGEGEHRRKNQNRRNLSQPKLNRKPESQHQHRKRSPPDEHLRQRYHLPEACQLPRKRGEEEIEKTYGDGRDSAARR
jgi:hypothetical protein